MLSRKPPVLVDSIRYVGGPSTLSFFNENTPRSHTASTVLQYHIAEAQSLKGVTTGAAGMNIAAFNRSGVVEIYLFGNHDWRRA